METIDIIMLMGLLLMITALVLMYRCARKDRPSENGRTCRSPCFRSKGFCIQITAIRLPAGNDSGRKPNTFRSWKRRITQLQGDNRRTGREARQNL